MSKTGDKENMASKRQIRTKKDPKAKGTRREIRGSKTPEPAIDLDSVKEKVSDVAEGVSTTASELPDKTKESAQSLRESFLGETEGREGLFQMTHATSRPILDKALIVTAYTAFLLFIFLLAACIIWDVLDKPVYKMVAPQDVAAGISDTRRQPAAPISGVNLDEKGNVFVIYKNVGVVNIYGLNGKFLGSATLPASDKAVEQYPQLGKLAMSIQRLEGIKPRDYLMTQGGDELIPKGSTMTIANKKNRVVAITKDKAGNTKAKIVYEKRSLFISLLGKNKYAILFILILIFCAAAELSNILEYKINRQNILTEEERIARRKKKAERFKSRKK